MQVLVVRETFSAKPYKIEVTKIRNMTKGSRVGSKNQMNRIAVSTNPAASSKMTLFEEI